MTPWTKKVTECEQRINPIHCIPAHLVIAELNWDFLVYILYLFNIGWKRSVSSNWESVI